jgi:chemotaxis signal transduction protein
VLIFFNCLVGLVLDNTRYALPLDSIERVVRVVEITPLPDASGKTVRD